MQRSKMQKIVDVLPKPMPEPYLREALGKIHNEKTRAKLEARYRRACARS